MDTRFHCVYLLCSLDPQCVGDYYIGYTVNPLRRLRQHNGELVNGAWRTKRRGRPWELLCCVSGFGEDRIALKFEWCWQHPTKSTRLKVHMALLRGVHRLQYAIGVMHFLLHADIFARLQLTLHIFEPTRLEGMIAELRQKVPGLPQLAETSLLRIEETTKERFQTQYIDEAEKVDDCVFFVTAQVGCSQGDVETSVSQPILSKKYLCEEDILRQHAREKEMLEAGHYPCSLCSLPLKAPRFVRCVRAPFCGLRTHLACLSMWFTFDAMRRRQGAAGKNGKDEEKWRDKEKESSGTCGGSSFASLALVPRLTCGCPLCDAPLQWGALIHDLRRRVVCERRLAERLRREKMEAALAERLRRMQSKALVERRRRKRAVTTAETTQSRQKKRCVNNNNSNNASNDNASGDSSCNGVELERGAITQQDDSLGFISKYDENSLFAATSERVVGCNSITDICDKVLQLTEFNLDEWLDV